MARVAFTLGALAALWLAVVPAGSSGATGAAQLRVAFITPIVTAPIPRDLWGQALYGFRRAVTDFGVQGRIVQSDPNSWAKTMTSVARQKFDLVFPGPVFQRQDFALLLRLARQYPATTFVSDFFYTAGTTRPKNIQGSAFLGHEASYLAGYLAALMERRRPGKDVISSVGGLPVFSVNQFIAGYQAGARKADPHITILNGYARSFNDPAKCRATALRQIAKGSGVVFNVAGLCGPGTLQAAKEKGVWAIGVDVDESFRGPHVLTSAIRRGDVWIYKTVESLVDGKLKAGGTVFWDLENDGVDLGKISPKVPRAFIRQVERIRARIEAGKIKVPDRLK
jgi:basic membrane protein A